MDPELQRLVDEQAVIALTNDYCWALDQRQFDDLDAIFTPDAIGDYGSIAQVEGVEAIKALMQAALGPLDASQHLVGSHQVAVDGDTATCRCNVQAQHVLRAADGGNNFIVGGYYEDDAVRTAAGWRIAKRRLVMTWNEGNGDVVAPG